jgi:hypothetical protein
MELPANLRRPLAPLSAATINVRLSAVRKMVGEARRAGMIGQEEAASLTDIPNIRQKGTQLGNWLIREQAKDLLGGQPASARASCQTSPRRPDSLAATR